MCGSLVEFKLRERIQFRLAIWEAAGPEVHPTFMSLKVASQYSNASIFILPRQGMIVLLPQTVGALQSAHAPLGKGGWKSNIHC